MRKCPKCNLSISKNSKKCEYCGVQLKKEVEDQIEELPDIIKTPNKITETESLETTSEIKINPIPLRVKPITSPKEIETNLTEKTTKVQLLSSIKIAIVIILLIANTILIVKIVSETRRFDFCLGAFLCCS